MDLLHQTYLGNPVNAWLTAALTVAVLFVVLVVVRGLLVSRLGALATRTTNQIDDMLVTLIGATRTWVLFVLALYAGLAQLNLQGQISTHLAPAAKLVLLWQTALWGASVIGFWVKHHLDRRTAVVDRAGIAMINAMGIGAKVILWILVAITTLKTVFAIEITPLITGLGVGGIAVALAVQNILGDLLAALAIVFDKPFDVGDTIGVDTITGTVEHIGLKTTRIRSVTGEQIIIGNGDLLKSRLRNFKRMFQRRVLFHIDVPFTTAPDALERLPTIIERIVSAQSPVKFDRCHVSSFGESGVRIETVYYVLDPDYKLYMDVQQAINIELLRRLAGERVRFAMPSRTVYHEGPLAKELAVGPQPQAAEG